MSRLNFSRGGLIDPTRGARESVNTAIASVGDLADRHLKDRIAEKELKQDREKALMTDSINRAKLAQNQAQHQDEMYLDSLTEDRLRSKAAAEEEKANRERRRDQLIADAASWQGSDNIVGLRDRGETLVEQQLGGRDNAIRILDDALQEHYNKNKRTTVLDHKSGWEDADAQLETSRRKGIDQSVEQDINGRGDALQSAMGVLGKETWTRSIASDFNQVEGLTEEGNEYAKKIADNIGVDYKKLEEERKEADKEYLDRFGKLYDLMNENRSDSDRPLTGDEAFKAAIMNNSGAFTDDMDWESVNELYTGFTDDSNGGWLPFGSNHQERAKAMYGEIVGNEELNRLAEEADLAPDAVRAVAGSVLTSNRTSDNTLEIGSRDALDQAKAQLLQGIRAKRLQEDNGNNPFTEEQIRNITENYRVALAPGERPAASTERGTLTTSIGNFVKANERMPQQASRRELLSSPNTSTAPIPQTAVGSDALPNRETNPEQTSTYEDIPFSRAELDRIANEFGTNLESNVEQTIKNNNIGGQALVDMVRSNPELAKRIEESGEAGIRPIDRLQALDRAGGSAVNNWFDNLLHYNQVAGEGLDTAGRYVLDRSTAPYRSIYKWLNTSPAEREAAIRERAEDPDAPSRSMFRIYR